MEKVLITGGNKGIGLELTKLFVENGYQVIVIARDFKDFKIDSVEKIVYDLSDVNGIEELVHKIGYVDILINNAGFMNSLDYNKYPIERRDKLMNINLYSPVALITYMSEYMLEHKKGRIVNTASVAGQMGSLDIWYGISKAGIINATKAFARLLGSKGIIINAVAPGPVETEMLNVVPEKRREFLKGNTYANRFAKAEEVAKTIYWLATESPEYINGVCVDLNNGAFPR